MSAAIRRLVVRLGHPHVATHLGKEELCLAFAAVAKLTPTTDSTTASTNMWMEGVETGIRSNSSNASSSSSGGSSSALQARVKRLGRACTPKEVGILAQGSLALGLCDATVLDLLIDQLYTATKSGTGRLSDVAAVCLSACRAIERETYANLTLRTIVKNIAPMLRKNDSPASLVDFLCAAHRIITSDEFATLLADVTQAANAIPSPKLVDAIASLPPFPPAVASKDTHDASVRDSNSLDGATGVQWTESRARLHLLNAALGEKQLETGNDVIVAMELYSYFDITDEVLHERLEDAAIAVMADANARTPRELANISKAAHAKVSLFPRARERLREIHERNDKSADPSVSTQNKGNASLQTVSAAFAAYQRKLSGRQIPDEIIISLLNNVLQWSADEVACVAYLLSDREGCSADFVARIAAHASSLTPKGCVALVRAAASDSTGSLLSVAERIVSTQILDKQFSGFDRDTVFALADVLLLPVPRGSSPAFVSFSTTMEKLRESLVEYMRQNVHHNVTLAEMCTLAERLAPIDKNKVLFSELCGRMKLLLQQRGKEGEEATATDVDAMLLSDALYGLRFLAAYDTIDEPLIDIITPPLKNLTVQFVDALSKGEALVPQQAGDLSRFLHYQVRFGAPELDAALSSVVFAAEQHVNAIPTLLLPAVILASRTDRRFNATRALLGVLVTRADAGELSDASIISREMETLAQALPELLSVCHGSDNDQLTTRVAESVFQSLTSPLLSHLLQASSTDESGPPLCPNAMAMALAAHAKYCSDSRPPDAVVDYVMEWMGALCAAAYTELAANSNRYTISPQDDLNNALVDRLNSKLDAMTSRQITDCIFGLGEIPGVGLRLSHQLAAERASDYVVDHAENFWSGEGIARMLFGFSRMQCTKRSLYNVFANRLSIRPVVYAMSQEAVSLAINAFGNVKYLDKKLFDRLAQRTLQVSRGLNAADITLTVRGYSRVMLLNPSLYNSLGDRATEIAGEFPPSAVCTLLESYGSVGVSHDEMATTLLDKVDVALPSMDGNEITKLLTALWQMHYPVAETGHFDKLAGLIAGKVNDLTTESILALCSIMQDTGFRNTQLLVQIADHSAQLIETEGITPECSRAVLDTLGTFCVYHDKARLALTSSARSVSKEVVQLSDEEQEHMRFLLQR